MGKISFFIVAAFVLVAFFNICDTATASPPDREAAMETAKAGIDEVLRVLRDPASKRNEKAARKKIRIISLKFFDYVEMSKRTLGLNWNRLNMNQRKEFVSLFTDLLEDTYVDRILTYSSEQVNFMHSVPLTEVTVEVRTTVTTKTRTVPINYRLIAEETGWRVYDVVIEGVSLVNNYRTQFREIMTNRTPEGLLETLRRRAGRTL